MTKRVTARLRSIGIRARAIWSELDHASQLLFDVPGGERPRRRRR